MRGDWPYDIVRMLMNWAMWVQNGRRPVIMTSFPAYQLANRGKRAANVMPIISVEAERSDRIICALPPRWQQPLRLHYCWETRSDRNCAQSCQCSINTYKLRLHQAHGKFADVWYQRVDVKDLTAIDCFG